MKLKEKLVEQAINANMYSIPWNVWLFIISGVGGVLWKCIRLFFRVGALEKQVELLVEQNAKQDATASKRNEKQDTDIKDIHEKANDTNTKVSTMLGYLDGKSDRS